MEQVLRYFFSRRLHNLFNLLSPLKGRLFCVTNGPCHYLFNRTNRFGFFLDITQKLIISGKILDIFLSDYKVRGKVNSLFLLSLIIPLTSCFQSPLLREFFLLSVDFGHFLLQVIITLCDLFQSHSKFFSFLGRLPIIFLHGLVESFFLNLSLIQFFLQITKLFVQSLELIAISAKRGNQATIGFTCDRGRISTLFIHHFRQRIVPAELLETFLKLIYGFISGIYFLTQRLITSLEFSQGLHIFVGKQTLGAKRFHFSHLFTHLCILLIQTLGSLFSYIQLSTDLSNVLGISFDVEINIHLIFLSHFFPPLPHLDTVLFQNLRFYMQVILLLELL